MRPTPTMDELRRVAEYWRWVSDMTCEHPQWVFASGEDTTCGECGRPIEVMSDIQIEALRERKS